MPVIKPIKNLPACPHCGGPVSVDKALGVFLCGLCGYVAPPDMEAPPMPDATGTVPSVPSSPTVTGTFPALPTDDPTKRPKARHPILTITHHGDVNHRTAAAFESAQYAVIQGRKPEAIAALNRALESQADFADAHLWLARLSDDPKVKRQHLEEILAYTPNHLEATRDMMVLNGRMTEEEAARTHHVNDQQVKSVVGAVTTKTETLRCPVCRGDLTVDTHDGHVECRFCGYHAEKAVATSGGGDLLSMALLERKAQPVRWQIGSRLLHCNNCGAERTIPGTTLSTHCPFCDSNHVVQLDALGSFQQPDGLIQFEVDEDTALNHIHDRLKGMQERLLSLFDSNAVKNAQLDATYLPFWVFDAMGQVTQTRTTKPSKYSTGFSVGSKTTQETFAEIVANVAICAISKPHPSLTRELGAYDYGALVAYKPRLLARHPAALYDIDFDKASLEARSRVSEQMRAKYNARDDNEIQITVSSMVTQMSFRLLLLPVWVATLLEKDGDTRIALVNGQSGHVVLGKARKVKA